MRYINTWSIIGVACSFISIYCAAIGSVPEALMGWFTGIVFIVAGMYRESLNAA